jgi:hypothetical protein
MRDSARRRASAPYELQQTASALVLDWPPSVCSTLPDPACGWQVRAQAQLDLRAAKMDSISGLVRALPPTPWEPNSRWSPLRDLPARRPLSCGRRRRQPPTVRGAENSCDAFGTFRHYFHSKRAVSLAAMCFS